MTTEPMHQPRPRVPGFAYAVILIALVIVLSVVTLTSRQPPPPSIAEFAPQAVEQIKAPPQEQSSEFGAGSAGSGPGGPSLGVGPAPIHESIDVPRIRKCIGDPPRQIEDPQSPPCVAYWSGDNGGATARGVTKDEIRVYAPLPGLQDANLVAPRIIKALERFFNKRFEFYGRQMNVIPSPGGEASDEASQRASAIRADEQERVFASTYYQFGGGAWYHQELARRGVISVMGPEMTLEAADHDAAAPYLWSYLLTADRIFAEVGQWVCARLQAGRAIHAGGVDLDKPRVFGVWHVPAQYQPRDMRPSIDPLLETLKACGIEPALVSDSQVAGGSDLTTGMRNMVTQMHQKGVTTVICLCYWAALHYMHQYAMNEGWIPEWLVSSYANTDTNFPLKLTLGPASPPEEMATTFGITFRPRQVSMEREPFNWALNESSPGLANDPSNQDLNHTWANREFYRSLLLLASGLQLAGPRLTPATFTQGLQRARFPNPEHPNFAGRVGFAGPAWSMTIDGAEWWWSNSARSPYPGDSAGSVCYVDGGRRHQHAAWPKGGDPFFDEPCDSGA